METGMNALQSTYWQLLYVQRTNNYLRRRLVSGGIVSLGIRLSRSECVCVRRISLGGEGNALYPVLSS